MDPCARMTRKFVKRSKFFYPVIALFFITGTGSANFAAEVVLRVYDHQNGVKTEHKMINYCTINDTFTLSLFQLLRMLLVNTN